MAPLGGLELRLADVNDEDLIVWQDVLDDIMSGRKGQRCPFCKNAQLVVESEQGHVRVSCPNPACKRYIEGSLGPDFEA